MSIFRYFLGCFLAAGLLAGCAGGNRPVGLSPGIELTELDSLPVPESGYVTRVQPGDLLEITVLNSEELSGTYVVDDDGTLDFPLIGRVPVAGDSATTVGKKVASQLEGRFLLNPNISVIPSELSQPTVSVGGEVEKPGSYPARLSRTLLRAVNTAGGLSEFAKSDDVLVLRSVGDVTYIGVYNIEAIQRGNYPDPQIYADDIITVGDSPGRRRLQTILQLVPLLSTSAILVDRIGN
ncbi:polysaccharide biosynthesis/export family protein [Pelagerythrobacter marinus]|jgi:polysaccharide export outer membrane protein|uniref:Polysaccharide export protein n=1 Tax=Pelagerythrobacter marinus TaxID=538382 RepID=A0ABW9UXZ3_9SPHN|nr:polysaccharide biosynthesis/export family protein [Pelagerythrobacter marinus]MEC9068331.1 polysaccharide biosynthesis/export family protein [Pseudomonadota bacterium]MXO68826.1 polysaccharide export protein [Pelagerythrobacter marinus]USA39134.1 polysaccharide export protein [Pelagerythrobacter marinus]WPZ06779.1 polysaccharide biosynthesis/export family protein [Pelagerythrobacter marinus]